MNWLIQVIIGCRSIERGKEAADEINNDERVKDNGKAYFKQLDLASFKSIRKFANEINNEEEAIDILINNAGVFKTAQDARTKDGFEMQFGVNHLGHFLLTLLLLDKLKQSKSVARIINVTSGMYSKGKIHFDNINMENNYDAMKAYAQSKLANVLFTRELAKRIKGTNIRVYAVHPSKSNANYKLIIINNNFFKVLLIQIFNRMLMRKHKESCKDFHLWLFQLN